jgi:hypothetical protein
MKHALTFTDNGRKLTNLLCSAAGIDPKKCVSLSVTCKRNCIITFAVELMGDEAQLGKALDALGGEVPELVDATSLTDQYQITEST